MKASAQARVLLVDDHAVATTSVMAKTSSRTMLSI